jgi:uncharacterized protein HemX
MLALSMGQVPGAATEVATKASNTIIESGVLGALLIVAVLGIVVLVWLLVRVQNARVSDIQKQAEVANRMVETFTQVKETLEELIESSKEEARALQAVQNTMQNILLLSKLAPPAMLPPAMPPHGNNPTGGTT